jgi:hypothetical protein
MITRFARYEIGETYFTHPLQLQRVIPLPSVFDWLNWEESLPYLNDPGISLIISGFPSQMAFLRSYWIMRAI